MDDRTSDADLVTRARSGDKDAFGILVMRHLPRAKRIAFGMVRNSDMAGELANESMLQAYLSLDRLRNVASFQSWLHGIVLNVCRSYVRSQRGAPLSYEDAMGGVHRETVALTATDPTPQEVVEAQELHQVVLRAVESLPPKARAATLLFYYDQLSVREVSATLGISVSAVKNRLHSARGRLREVLMPLHAGPRRTDMVINQEDRRMIEVKVTDVVERRRGDQVTGEEWSICVVLLVDEENRRLLPIWLGEAEGRAIAMGLRDVETPRPMTFAFVANLLRATDVQVEGVRIDSLRDDTFYGVVRLQTGGETVEVDARPSDAIALALNTDTPIHATQEVLELGGTDIPDGAMKVGAGDDVQSILERYHQATNPMRQEAAEGEEEHDDETRRDVMQRSYQDLISALYGE